MLFQHEQRVLDRLVLVENISEKVSTASSERLTLQSPHHSKTILFDTTFFAQPCLQWEVPKLGKYYTLYLLSLCTVYTVATISNSYVQKSSSHTLSQPAILSSQ